MKTSIVRQILIAQEAMNQNEFYDWLINNKDNLIEKERSQIHDAMMYAFDEDGHTGSWKISVIEKYYRDTFLSPIKI